MESLPGVISSVITGVVGGVLRDVLCSDVPLVFVRGDFYASAAWAGALALTGLQTLGASPVIAAWCGLAIVLAVRLIAMAFPSPCTPIPSANENGPVARPVLDILCNRVRRVPRSS